MRTIRTGTINPFNRHRNYAGVPGTGEVMGHIDPLRSEAAGPLEFALERD